MSGQDRHHDGVLNPRYGEGDVDQRQALVRTFGLDAAQALWDWAEQHHTSLHDPRPLPGGRTDARVAVVYEIPAKEPPRTLVVKVGSPDGAIGGPQEAGRHLAALNVSPAFSDAHLVRFPYEPLRVAHGRWATFQEMAGGSLTDVSRLSEIMDRVVGRRPGPDTSAGLDDVAAACRTVVRALLVEWAPARGETMDVWSFLGRHLAERHESGGSLHTWAAAHAPELLDRSTRWIQLPGTERPLPNPVALARDPSLTRGSTVFALVGPAHGDLHPGNVLIPTRPRLRASSFRLVDLDRFAPDAPLSRDPVHFALSIVEAYLDEVSEPGRDALIDWLVHQGDDRRASLVAPALMMPVHAVVDEASAWAAAQGLTDEWRAQTQLAVLAWALAFTGRRWTADHHRPWFLRLAAEAAEAHLSCAGTDHAELRTAPTQATPIEMTPAPAAAPSAIGPQPRGQVDGAGPSGERAAVVPGERSTRHRPMSVTARTRHRTVEPDLLRAAGELADRVQDEWTTAASGRRLLFGRIEVRWAKPVRPVVGPLSEALGDVDAAGGSPLPGATEPTPEALTRGEVSHLLRVYCGLPAGRLVIIGRPGAGKTAAAIRLVLDILKYRASRSDPERAAIAVPVLLTPRDWDPERQPVSDWLERRLASDYPRLRAGPRGTDTAALLVRAGLVALVLDGLDDMPERARSAALRALDRQNRLRMVVVGRSEEMEAAAAAGHLAAAVAVELQPVEAREAADYLVRSATDPLPQDRQRLVDRVRAVPDGPVAQALDSPLMLGLVRDTYGRDDDVGELLDTDRFPTREAVEDHLLARVVPVAYRAGPDAPPPREGVEQAQRWLGHLAYRMHRDATRDFAWWRLHRWIPAWRHVMGTGLVSGALFGALCGALGWWGGRPGPGFAVGLLVGPAAALFEAAVLNGDECTEARVIARRVERGYVLATMVTGVIAGVLLDGAAVGSLVGLVAGVVAALVVAVPGTRWMIRARRFNGRPNGAADIALTPATSWRQERRQEWAFGALLGIAIAVTLLLATVLVGENLAEVVGAVLLSLVLMPAFVITLSARSRTTLAALQLWAGGRGPVRLVRFLEDARERNVLRSAGAVYQFRHARLQDVLARWYAETEGLPFDPPEGPPDPRTGA
jgi:hypothetical protein